MAINGNVHTTNSPARIQTQVRNLMGDTLPAMQNSPEVRLTVATGSGGAKPVPPDPRGGYSAARANADNAGAPTPADQMRQVTPGQIQRWSTSSRFT
ncbi:hypothetical protein [Stenotrophomonas thermophila]|nr:hypothetical protein BN1263240046 [Stenotrophomonas maltophilia]